MFIYTLCLVFLLAYEAQRVAYFNFFFKLKCITIDYTNYLKTKTKSVAFKELLKISLIELLYVIILFVGIYTKNNHLCLFLLFIQAFETYIFKKIKKLRKTIFIIDSIISITILSLCIINLMFYQLDSFQFIKLFLT